MSSASHLIVIAYESIRELTSRLVTVVAGDLLLRDAIHLGGFDMPRKAAKRELINTGTDKRFVRRDKQGQFKESDDVGRSLAQDQKRKAKTKVKSGQGDRGDRKR